MRRKHYEKRNRNNHFSRWNGNKHGGKTLKEMESPFVILGNNIKKGHEIEEFMMQYDIAATIAYIFGLETPQAWIGRPVLSVFDKLRKQ